MNNLFGVHDAQNRYLLPRFVAQNLASSLALIFNLSIVDKGRQDLFVSEVLAPGLELFGRITDILAELNKRISKAVRVEIRKKCMAQGILTRLVTQPSNGSRRPHVSAWEEALGRGNLEEMHVTQPSKVLWCPI